MSAKPPRAEKRVRADLALVDQGLAPSREKARALILAGEVLAGDRPIAKAGDLIDAGAELRLRSAPMPYVSRGGIERDEAARARALAEVRAAAAALGYAVGADTVSPITGGKGNVEFLLALRAPGGGAATGS